MLANYFKIAWRNLWRHKSYTAINVFGLAVGLAVCLLIVLFVQHERSFDRFHEQSDRLYRVLNASASDDRFEASALTPELLAPELDAHVPAVERAMRLDPSQRAYVVRAGDRAFYEEHFYHADPEIFDVFSFPFDEGDPETALVSRGSVVLTVSAAEKYFPDGDAIGQTLEYRDETYTVTGVLEDLPTASHLQFDFLAHLVPQYDRWMMHTSYTYALLQPDASKEHAEAQIQRMVESVVVPELEIEEHSGYALQSITDIHLSTRVAQEPQPGGDERYLHLFSGAALLILLLACINYVNLATARATRRAREVGVRKSLGAQRGQLVRQFLGEAAITSALALVIAFLFARLLLPLFNQMADRSLSLAGNEPLLLGFAGIVLIVGLLSGFYPAVVLSGFKPTAVLQGASGRTLSGAGLRKGLVTFQFAVTIVLLVATAVIYSQLTHMQEQRLGFDQEQVVIVEDWERVLRDSYHGFRQELLRHPSVTHVTSGQRPDEGGGLFMHMPAEEEDDENVDDRRLRIVNVDYDYPEMLGFRLLEGRFFDRGRDSGTAYIANERAVRLLGLDEPIGHEFETWSGSGPIVGVVEDFHMRSLHDPLEPVLLGLRPGYGPTMLVRLAPEQTEAGLTSIRATWNSFAPEHPLQYTFLADEIDALYHAERRLAGIFGGFAALAILIACLGLFGLAAFAAERRRQEIGIRKVLGATAQSIVALLSKDFLKLVLIGFVLAAPVAYYAMSRWLEDFAYRIDIGPDIFALAGILAIGIALVTVSYQALRAAWMNPTDAIRQE